MYVDGVITPVPEGQKQAYLNFCFQVQGAFMENGATRYIECWSDDVPDGEHTSFPLAVDLQPGERVVFSWIEWPDKKTRDEGWKKAMEDPRMKAVEGKMPFDGKRMVFGGFEAIVEAAWE